MKIDEWLRNSIEQLESADILTSRLDCEVLLATALNKDRSWVLAHPEFELNEVTLETLDLQIKKRSKHEPIAYILGKQEFYGREFIVNSDTLQPRPETEAIIEILKSLKPEKIIDIGTGSGCIAITAKLELPDSEVTATDISQACLDIAGQNATKLEANITIVKSDLLQDISVKDIAGSTICCNLPYVPNDFLVNRATNHEPDKALFGGDDGLDYYRQLFEEIISLPENLRPESVVTESLPSQHEDLVKIADVADYRLDNTMDFIQVFKTE